MDKSAYRLLLSLLVFALLAAACAPANPAQDERLGQLEAKVSSLSGLETDLTTLKGEVDNLSGGPADFAALQSRLDGLQTKIDELEAGLAAMGSGAVGAEAAGSDTHPEDPFSVSMAQYVMDSAGFHAMAETLSETKQVDPAYLGKVNQVQKILSNTPWPEPLAEQGHAFLTLLEDLAAALEADNGEGAVILSDQVHDAQHELSHAIDEWLGTASGEHGH